MLKTRYLRIRSNGHFMLKVCIYVRSQWGRAGPIFYCSAPPWTRSSRHCSRCSRSADQLPDVLQILQRLTYLHRSSVAGCPAEHTEASSYLHRIVFRNGALLSPDYLLVAAECCGGMTLQIQIKTPAVSGIFKKIF